MNLRGPRFAALFLLLATRLAAGPVHLRCEYLENPMGLDKAPQFSWQSDATERNWMQSAFQILVASSEENLRSGKVDVWDSGKVNSGESVGILYAGPKLESQRRYFWKVRVWDANGKVADSGETAWWEMGLLNPSDWIASWIAWKNPESDADRASMRWIWIPGQDALNVAPKTVAHFQAKIQLNEKPRDAAFFVTARGSYIAEVNGHEVAHKREWIAFDRCDITEHLVVGENVIRIRTVSPNGPSFGSGKDVKAFPAAFAGLVKITAMNGQILRFGTAEHWESKLESDTSWRPANIVADLGDPRFGDPGSVPEAAPEFRKEIVLASKIKSARVFVTALGSYQLFVNGKLVGKDVLTPEFTDYNKRVIYQTYDVTALLGEGKNTLAALLGDGWHGSPLTWAGAHFFDAPNRFIAQLEVDYADNHHQTFVTDESWKGSASPVLKSEIYAGELYDARLEKKGWNSTGFDDAQWSSAFIAARPSIALSSQITTAPQVVMTLKPKALTRASGGTYVFDFGQNMVGWASLRVKGPAGARVRLRFAEILQPDGSIYVKNLRDADATDTYVLKGESEEKFTPHFTFHGFRYVEVSGYPGNPTADALTAEVVSSVPAEPVGRLSTSSDLVNKMWGIGIWGQRGNFLSIPTDCPQRDERLGWMGDAGVFWRTGGYNFDIAAFSQKFMQDIVDAQTPQGAYTNVSPDTLPFADPEFLIGAPGWGDAGVIVPWTTWMQYGNTQVIARNWDSMQQWMNFVYGKNPDFLRSKGVGPNFADWLAPDENTDKTLLATAYWALTADMMAEMAHAIGHDDDAARYRELLGQIRSAFRKAYIKEGGIVGTGTQTSYVVSLYTKMAPKELEPLLVDNLVKAIESRNGHLSTGFLGTPFLLFVLSDHGRSDIAYHLLLNETYPSWGYMLSKGATTWWERWNGDTGDPAMNSYNHYAFGSVVAWVYRQVAGIDTTTSGPGFKKIVIRPRIDSRMTSAKGEYRSVYGKISTDWSNAPDKPFRLRVVIPANTSAEIYLPSKPGSAVYEGSKKIEATSQDGSLFVRVGSGSYDFEVR